MEGSDTYTDICHDNCSDPQIFSGLAAGTYIIRVQQSDNNSDNFCSEEIAAIVSNQLVGTNTTTNRIAIDNSTSDLFKITDKSQNRLTSENSKQALAKYPISNLPVNANNSTNPIVKVYPNPAQYQLFVNLSTHTGKKSVIRIINQVGTILKQMSIDQLTDTPYEIDLNNEQFRNGLYFMQVQFDQETLITKKFMISNR